ncbi:hypothetical protein RJ639_026306 [Escallonia herrerae]|uniref:Uncharacterized protein n=1 Tax=Escallonia herrerae TaxID=1293975 RepID=A0AA88UTE5_9ASTE|nr:hypothetical protein RJ639_026306 [Escallonia herrerae]
MVREDERLLSEGEELIVSVGELINADSQSQRQDQNIPRIYTKPFCMYKGLVMALDRIPSSAPSEENGKKNEDPVPERDELLLSVEQMIKKDAARIHAAKIRAAARGSDQLPAPCIFKVPDKLRELKASAYAPRVVSIGPLHKDDKHLRKDMARHKKSYMHSLFRRTSRSDEAAEADVVKEAAEADAVEKAANECVDAILGMVDEARACYEPSHELCDDDDDVKFAEMLILDGCFVLELLYKKKEREFNGDPIFSNVLVHLDIIHDLVLLENQIPFFVLEKLFDCTLKGINGNSSRQDPPSLTNLILDFFETLNIFEDSPMKKNDITTSDSHILGLLYNCYRPSDPQENNNEYHDICKHSAAELDRAGVNFVAYSPETNSVNGMREDYLDLKFNTSCCFDWLCGTRAPSDQETNSVNAIRDIRSSDIPYSVLDPTRSRRCCRFSWFCQLFGRSRFEIPKLFIFDTTETFLRNLIAFEQCYHDIGPRHITSYAYLMDTLIDSKEDVHLLEDAGVIKNNLGASEDASDLFNNLCKEVVLDDILFFSQWKQVDDYYNRPWPRSLASLRRNYFSNPWSGISVIAALILFALTVVQTVYSIRSST